MTTPKYKLTLNELQRPGNINKLERDGFTSEQIHKVLFKETDGISRQERTQLMEKLYDRRK